REKGEQVILFCHFPIGPDDAHNLLNDVEVRAVLEKYDHVVAWLNGHNHKGHFERKNNQYFITLPGMVETEDTNAWGVVTLYPDSLIVSGSGRTPDLNLPIKKKN
ncbi:MAG: hypothetical protein OEX02_19575, partial [Cyclobacteriaceae bacterium]|nr:hypothetical protein [Cyclobacteriaceae bacterium]